MLSGVVRYSPNQKIPKLIYNIVLQIGLQNSPSFDVSKMWSAFFEHLKLTEIYM